ncbi:SDR family oxidoreductase [Dendrosporobacter sp. 1207_IL3150]|uniref:SDR family oxidoreductase n=1 Tax=Dendrosporobacter sp. 1207_IL3150 TaxID=3084054 RepID=UPI002FDB8812
MSQESVLLTQAIDFPAQHQTNHPGLESLMTPRPLSIKPEYLACGKLTNKVAIITGGDSGIGRAVSLAFAREGADIVIVYFDEHDDAAVTKKEVEQSGQRCITLSGDVGQDSFCNEIIAKTIKEFGKLDILVNNAAVQYTAASLLDITSEQWEKTFRTNIFAYFYLTKAALPHLKSGSTIINTASVTAYEGHELLIDYASTKGAIVTFTRSLSQALVGQGIRVNGVAPGPIWTPLIPSSFDEQQVAEFGKNTPMKRAGQPAEVAPSYVFLASEDSAYMTGQMLHINGGKIING